MGAPGHQASGVRGSLHKPDADAWGRQAVRKPFSLVPLVLALAFSGCADDKEEPAGDPVASEDCFARAPVDYVYFFGPGHSLLPSLPAAGSEPGNAFSSGFLTDDLKEWLSEPVQEWMWI